MVLTIEKAKVPARARCSSYESPCELLADCIRIIESASLNSHSIRIHERMHFKKNLELHH